MPLLSRLSARAAMLYLLLGLGSWTLFWLNRTRAVGGNWSALRPVSIHLITVGWLTQLIFAVIFWMFPIVSRGQPRGASWIAWFGFVALNLGLIARAVFEIGMTHGLSPDAGWGLAGAALLQWSGGTAWILSSWPRIRERGGR